MVDLRSLLGVHSAHILHLQQLWSHPLQKGKKCKHSEEKQRNEFDTILTISVLPRFNRELGKNANLLHQVSQQAALAI
jgi:hypothetical protein